MGRYSSLECAGLIFALDAVVDLLQELIDLPVVADAIENEVAQIAATYPGRAAACVLLSAFKAVGDGAAAGALILHVLGQKLTQERPPFEAVHQQIPEVIPAPKTIFKEVSKVAAALQPVENKIAEMAAIRQTIARIAIAAGAVGEEIALIFPAAKAISK